MTGKWGLQEGCTVHRSLWNSIPALVAEHSWSTVSLPHAQLSARNCSEAG